MSFLRKLYYQLFNNRQVVIKEPALLNGYIWIIDEKYGRAYFKGYYEPELTKYIAENLPEDGCFLDIGAHAGYFSLLASVVAKKGSVLSFEPDNQNFSFIKKIKALNNISYWNIINAAVGKESGELRFKTGASSSTGFVDADGDVVVKQVAIDTLVKEYNINRIDLIKIDVEGFGANVIRGGLEALLKFKPQILFECHRGSDEFAVAWELLSSTFDFFDFSSMQKIEANTGKQIDFVLLKAKA
ncbi:MAG: FkbM family methyltransferase [Flavihumibacter sp.]|nr:FkbM family methyltransferase [Flavihumibacter sp.]